MRDRVRGKFEALKKTEECTKNTEITELYMCCDLEEKRESQVSQTHQESEEPALVPVLTMNRKATPTEKCPFEKMPPNVKPRFLQDEGLYVRERPEVSRKIWNKMENRLFKQEKGNHWFGEDGNLIALSDPIRQSWSNKLDFPFDERDPAIKTVYKKAIKSKLEHSVICDLENSSMVCQLDLNISSLVFTHHPLFSREHVLAVRLIQLYDHYLCRQQKNRTHLLSEKLRALKHIARSTETNLNDSSHRVKDFKKQIRETRKILEDERQADISLFKNIMMTWKQIKSLRKTQGYANTKVKLQVQRLVGEKVTEKVSAQKYAKEQDPLNKDKLTDKQICENIGRNSNILANVYVPIPDGNVLSGNAILDQAEFSSDQIVMTNHEGVGSICIKDGQQEAAEHFRLEQFHEEFNFVTDEEFESSKRFRLLQLRNSQVSEFCGFKQIPLYDREIPDSIFEGVQRVQRCRKDQRCEITELYMCCDLEEKRESQVSQTHQESEEPALVPVLTMNRKATPTEKCPLGEQRRRNEIQKTRFLLKIFYNEKQVSCSKISFLDSDFTVEFQQIFSIQIMYLPESIRLEICENIGRNSNILANVYVPIPDGNVLSGNAILDQAEFSSDQIVMTNHEGVGSICIKDGQQEAAEHFRLEQFHEEFNFVTDEEFESSKRFRLLQLRNSQVSEFCGFKQIPLYDREIPDSIFEVLNLARKRLLKVKCRYELSDIVAEYEQVDTVTQLNLAIFKHKHRLKPTRKERKSVPAQVLSDGDVKLLVTITRAYNIPARRPSLTRSMGGDYSYSGLSKVKDKIFINVFDEIAVDVQEVSGTFRLNTPLISLGYTWKKEDMLPDAQDNYLSQTESCFLSIFVTIDPQISTNETDTEKFATNEDEKLLEVAYTYEKHCKTMHPRRRLLTAVIDTEGRKVLATRYIKALPPPQELLQAHSEGVQVTFDLVARFVSLIPLLPYSVDVGDDWEMWFTSEGETAYVVTQENRDYVLWNPRTGECYEQFDVFCPLQTADCLISEHNPSEISYRPTDTRFVEELESRIEKTLQMKLMEWRSHHPTRWHRQCILMFRHILPRLECNPGGAVLEEQVLELETVLKEYKVTGFPVQMPYMDMKTVIETIHSTGIHNTEIPGTEFAIAVYIHPYPNNILSLWIYLASLVHHQ
ncbi:UNVERIFIED_CONTAM: hypothetical protein FKN15_026663 [Acipenser sinensis]